MVTTIKFLFDDLVEEARKLAAREFNNTFDNTMGMYYLLLPMDMFHTIKSIDGQCIRVNEKMGDAIMGIFMEHDKIHCPTYIAGGSWLNHGFGVNENIPDNEVWATIGAVEYKPRDMDTVDIARVVSISSLEKDE